MGNQRGQAIVFIALMLTVIIGMAAIAIDGSRAYALRRDLQGAVDAAALAAGDSLQQTGNWWTAEQAAVNEFDANMRLNAPSCGPFGAPGATAFTVTCTYLPDTAVFTLVAQGIGPQGSQFTVSGQRNLQLQFARILTNGSSPAIASSSIGNVNNQRYTPAFGALDRAGCGSAGNAISLSGAGTLQVKGDVVSNGAISLTSGALRVAGDIDARCQSPVPGAVTNACYPSALSTPCGYPDVAGVTRTGFYLADPGYPLPTNLGSGQGLPTSVVVLPGIYASAISIGGGHCWFLSGGVYTFEAGALNTGDLVSNELKPPDEPSVLNNALSASPQFWNADGANCAGGFELSKVPAAHDVPTGMWSIVVTSVRNDVYNGVSYNRESAPSHCQQLNVNLHFNAIQVDISNVPGATSYKIYAAPPGNGCAGPFGLADTLAVSGTPTNINTSPCPMYTGGGCSLGHETDVLDDQLVALTVGTNPPDAETAPLAAGLPNQNPGMGPGVAGDRANENNCDSVAGAHVTCPNVITPGAVELYFPAGACFINTNGGDTYVFSGQQYNWVSVYEPPGSGCANTFGAASNSAYIGLIYTPSAHNAITSPYVFESAGTGGMIADTLAFSGSLPTITFNASYAPVPPASRLTG